MQGVCLASLTLKGAGSAGSHRLAFSPSAPRPHRSSSALTDAALHAARTISYEAGRSWRFVTMDPGTEYWQETIAAAAGNVAHEGNTSGVYIDQVPIFY